MAKTKLNCLNCNQETWIENKEIRRGFGKFCSRKCSGEYRSKNTMPLENNVKCALCKKDFHLSGSKQEKSKSGFYFCCRAHKDAAQRIGGIVEIMPTHYGTGSPENIYRRVAFATRPKKCERCGYDTNEAAIIVHHKDRNRSNAADDNLEILCANCHAIEHHGEENKMGHLD
jgi:5-methylcytosine-specific restriction endonuclease McrA